MRGLKLRPASSVEVDIDIHHKGDVWYPATLIKQVNSNSFLVKFLISKEVGFQKVVVDYSHIRPSPTGAYRKSYSLMDKVDAFYDNGWWSGVVTKNFAGKRYVVCLDRTNKEEELRHADLRLHMEWSYSNGRWFQSPPGGVEKRPVTQGSSQQKHILVSDIVNGTSHTNSAVLSHEHNGKTSPSQSADSGQSMKEEHIKAVETEKEHCEASKDHDSPNNGGVRQKEGEVINQKRKRGRPPKVFSQVNSPKTKEAGFEFPNEVQRWKDHVDGMCLKRMSIEGDVGYDSRNNKMKALDSIVVRDVETVGASTSSDVNDGDRSLSRWFEGAHTSLATDGSMTSPTTAGHCEETGERQDHNKKQLDSPIKEKAQENKKVKTPATDVNHENNDPERQNEIPVLSTEIAPLDVEDLPFVKISKVWKMIETMEVFKKIPQKPHFRPLYNCKEECREGLAIGNMITFASLVDRVPRLQFWDPRSVIDGYMEALNDLEAMGLNVEAVREKLKKLLELKSREEFAINTVKEMESQVVEREHEKLKLSEEINEVDKKIQEHNQKRSALESRREVKDAEIASLESSRDGVKVSLKEIEEEFEKVVASFR